MRTHNAYENVIVRDVFDLARDVLLSESAAQASAHIMQPTLPFVIRTPLVFLLA